MTGLEKHISSMMFKTDLHTGCTPERKRYVHDTTWELTDDHNVLLEKFRQVRTALMETREDDNCLENDELSQSENESIQSLTENDMEVVEESQATKLPVPRRSHRKRGGVLTDVN